MMGSSSAEKAKKLRQMKIEGFYLLGMAVVFAAIGKWFSVKFLSDAFWPPMVLAVVNVELARFGLILVGHGEE